VSSKIGRLGAGRAGGRTSLFALRCAAAVALAWGACGPALASTAPEQRGFVSDGVAGSLVFQRCQPDGRLAGGLVVQDRTPGQALSAGIAEVQQVRHDADQPLYVEFRGEVVGKVVTARRFLRAIGHVQGCRAAQAAMQAEIRLMAQGSGPAWRLLATPEGTHLEFPGARPLKFSAIRPEAVGHDARVRRLTAAAVQSPGVLNIELTEQPCNDMAAETAYGARAVATLGPRRFEGCAARF